jgi:hypothetical protein
MRQEISASKLEKGLAYIIALVLLLVPFHAFFTAWAASRFGHFDLIRIWKELLIVILGLGAVWLLYKDQTLARKIFKNRLVQIVLIYIILQIVLGLLALSADRVNLNALLYGWIINIRFLALFLVALIVAAKVPLAKQWHKLLFWPAAIAVGFGLVQQLFLPPDFLLHFGYGPDTLLPYQAVDLKTAYIRLQSTLRGPNPFGVYLILIITAALAVAVTQKPRVKQALLLASSTLALYFTYSRSAWIGTFLSAVLLLWLFVKSPAKKKALLMISVGFVALAISLVILLRNNDHVQNIFFHTDEHSTSSASSNFDRAGSIKNGFKDILYEPVGAGPGTAGPASLRNDQGARIAENYFLQIGQEAGVIGVLLFLTINAYVAAYLFRQNNDTLSLVLASSFVGISVANLLSHAWADDTISLIWWGLAGIALAPAILNKKRKHNVWTKEKTTA